MSKAFLICASVSGFLGVAAGAFGAHALKTRLSPEMLAVFETGVRYQMYHVAALLGIAFVAHQWPSPTVWWAGISFVAGTVVFSGSLYVLSLSGVRWWGAITPIGGTLLLMGWALLAWAIWKQA